ncbi:MAG: glycosyl hydrolase [Prolixibacteraceae bacterium]
MKIFIILILLQNSCLVIHERDEEDSLIRLGKDFINPPLQARLRAYWWWINGNVTKEAITCDLGQMKLKGFGGAVLCDVDRSYAGGNNQVPHGPDFMSSEWRDLYRHALKEAGRLGLEISLNITSGWPLGGPMIQKEDAPKILVWSRDTVQGPATINRRISLPKVRKFIGEAHRAHEKPAFKKEQDSLYQDILLIAYPRKQGGVIKNWEIKAMHKPLHASAPDTRILFEENELRNEPAGIRINDVIDLSDKLAADGTLQWDVPEGEWEILRLGYTIYSKGMKWASSEGWGGFPIDPFDASVFKKYRDLVVNPLIADAGDQAGMTLKYLHTDSWELEPVNWTPSFREEFQKRRGYDLLPFVPALVGNVVESSQVSHRFLNDFRKTFGDLVIDNHYRIFRDLAVQKKMLIHPESGGPHAMPIDAQRCLGFNDVPMSEFWAKSETHRITDEQRFFVKQPASAAHTYGKKTVMAEGFTTVGPHWQETIWDNLKPTFDRAACEGMNLLVWHAFSCSPKEAGIPGQEAFAGTHLNPNSTWWSRSEAFLSYINRCQVMLQHGLFVADVAYYYGDHVPNFAQLKKTDPANILPGYDYDVVTEEVILERMRVSDGMIVLPDGMHYRLLALPDYPGFSLSVLKKIEELVRKGAVVVGPKPAYMNSLKGFPEADNEFRALTNRLWGEDYSNNGFVERRIGKGRIYAGIEAGQVLRKLHIRPDLSWSGGRSDSGIDYIHRSDSLVDIYFLSNQTGQHEKISFNFRITGKQPEFWDAVSGKRWEATDWTVKDGGTILPVELSPYGSLFVVFAKEGTSPSTPGKANFLTPELLKEIDGDWTVSFQKEWGGPESVVFRELSSWTDHDDPGIKYYSGTATYKIKFNMENETQRDHSGYFIDLGRVKELAEVRLNGKQSGIVWAAPFRVEITASLQPGENELEIDVVNFWPNRIIGDQFLPVGQRYTRTNITKLTKDTPLSVSGLLGPVRLFKSTELSSIE